MATLTRRSVLRSSLALTAAGSLARPFVARAAAKTAEVWWIQGFAQEEDIAFKKVVDDYQKASGNTLEYSIVPYAPLRQKIVSAITSGAVPDLFQNSPTEVSALYAWDDKLLDVTDVIETQKSEYTETALTSAYNYNSVSKKRSFYLVPYTTAALPNHIWRPLVEKAGFTMEDVPRTWDAYYDFFKEVQMDFQAIIAGTVGKENTFGTCVGRVKSGAMSFARFSTDDLSGKIRGYAGEGRFTDDPLETFGGAGVVEIPNMQKLLHYICENGFEHHVAANFSTVAPVIHEATTRYLGWDMYAHA